MHDTQPIETGTTLKRTACLIILLMPMLGWTQSVGSAVPVSAVKAQEPAKAVAMASPAAAREVSLSEVFDRLGLSAPQQSLWNFFRGRLDGYTSAYYRQEPIVPSPMDAAPRQVGRMVDNLQNRLAALEEVEAAVKNLYESLTPEQQKTANELLILTIPMFLPSNSESTHSSADTHRKDSKPDAGKRSRHGGTGGAMAGSILDN